MEEAGIVAVEADDPKQVVQLMPTSSLISGDDLFMSALAGLTCGSSYSSSDTMLSVLKNRLEAKEKTSKNQSTGCPQ
jgi:hypothetical protein